jgi:hypothetical protein
MVSNHPLLQREVVPRTQEGRVSERDCTGHTSASMHAGSVHARPAQVCHVHEVSVRLTVFVATHPRPHATATCHSALRRTSDSRSVRDHARNELAWVWRWGVVEMFTFGRQAG